MSISTPASPDETQPAATRRRGRVAVLVLFWVSLAVATHWPQAGPPTYGGYFDKVLHLVAYAVLAWLLCWAWRPGRSAGSWRWALRIVLLLAAYGAIDEVTQMLVNRSCDLHDWLADLVGVAVGVSAYAMTLKYSSASARDSHPGQST